VENSNFEDEKIDGRIKIGLECEEDETDSVPSLLVDFGIRGVKPSNFKA
jgi:hypothetical protein